MPISDFPFLKASDADLMSRPWLFVRINNPDTGRFLNTIGLIDTGADECCLPASYAQILGHNLTAGTAKNVNTGNGCTTAYGHTCTIDIFDTPPAAGGKDQNRSHNTEDDYRFYAQSALCPLRRKNLPQQFQADH